MSCSIIGVLLSSLLILNIAFKCSSLENEKYSKLVQDDRKITIISQSDGTTIPTSNEIKFYHYPIDQSSRRLIEINCTTCLEGFDSSVETVIVGHGWNGSPNNDFGQTIRRAFYNRGTPVNLIYIDWTPGANTSCYICAVNNSKEVGTETAAFVDFLIAQNVATMSKIIFVAHSLAAHIPNFVNLHTNNGKFAKLHALDPAGPLYQLVPDTEKLDKTDAEFVSVIHSDMHGYGMAGERGHVDFYPNSGSLQPGCPALDRGCSHERAYKFFAESMTNPGSFIAVSCSSWETYLSGECHNNARVEMGWNVSSETTGTFYLETNEQSPFGKGDYFGTAVYNQVQ